MARIYSSKRSIYFILLIIMLAIKLFLNDVNWDFNPGQNFSNILMAQTIQEKKDQIYKRFSEKKEKIVRSPSEMKEMLAQVQKQIKEKNLSFVIELNEMM